MCQSSFWVAMSFTTFHDIHAINKNLFIHLVILLRRYTNDAISWKIFLKSNNVFMALFFNENVCQCAMNITMDKIKYQSSNFQIFSFTQIF